MKLLALSGSTRRVSTNTALLRALQAVSPSQTQIEIYDRVGSLPVFSPDLEGVLTPREVSAFMASIHDCDGLIISSPEYVRSIPGGLKNAIDWLVSTNHAIDKPIALVHASHRGDDMLQMLRTVLATISPHFTSEIFLRVPLLGATPDAIAQAVDEPSHRLAARTFLETFASFCRERSSCKPV